MSIKFNADEVFALAERIEEDGARFYRKAAGLQPNKKEAQFLLTLATMEDQHKATFAAMRKTLAGDMKGTTTFDPYLEAELYLSAMADSHGGEGTDAAIQGLKPGISLDTILKTAIGLEGKSIVFYVGIKDMVPEDLGKAKIDDIINQEKSHIVTLTNELKNLKK